MGTVQILVTDGDSLGTESNRETEGPIVKLSPELAYRAAELSLVTGRTAIDPPPHGRGVA